MEKIAHRVHPYDQPVRPAIALVVVSVLLGVVWALTALIPRFFMDDLQEAAFTEGFQTRMLVIGVILSAAVLLMLGLGLASFILAIVVTVKGGGRLRLGAGLMIAASLFGLVISFTVSGDTSQMPDAAVALSNAFSILEVIVDVVRAVVMVVGVVFLILGIREVRRERAELPAR